MKPLVVTFIAAAVILVALAWTLRRSEDANLKPDAGSGVQLMEMGK